MSTKPIIIGVGHYSRTGKDSWCNFMLRELQENGLVAKKVPFAWKLKDIAHQLYGWAGLREPEFYETDEGARLRDVPLSALSNEKWPLGPTPVDLWVAIGTDAFRQQIHVRTWIDYVLNSDHKCDVLFVPDTRFFNEVRAIKNAGGMVMKIIRPGFQPRETIADLNLINYRDWHAVIGFQGTLEANRDFGYGLVDRIVQGRFFPNQLKKDWQETTDFCLDLEQAYLDVSPEALEDYALTEFDEVHA